MRLLVLGGTAWLGRCIVRTAVELGHDVTCLARGLSGDAPDGAVFVHADRSHRAAYDDVATEKWDAVVDVARQPGQVRSAVEALAGRTSLYVFVSSGNVYADHSTPGQDEDGALLAPLEGDVMESMESYGEAKVACEHHVLRGMGRDRALIARVGLIGGPGDIFDRSGYWPLRFARPVADDGAVLVPDAPDLVTQVIDVRDLAAWIVDAAHRGVTGTFNATGDSVPFLQHLETARAVAGHAGPVIRADQRWLLSWGVQEWMGPRSLPLWLADPAWIGFNANDSSRARAAGLVTRPLNETLADTLAWEKTRDPARTRQAGLSDDQERALLEALASGRQPTSHERLTGQPWDASYRDGPPPWDVGQPQPAIVHLASEGGFAGAVLDAGCGTGENALHVASSGLQVLGVDVAETALAIAREKAEDRGIDAEFVVADAFQLGRLGRRFDTVLDCGLFHTFDGDERRGYVASLASVTERGGTLYVLCFSDAGPDTGPHPVAREALRAAFDGSDGWTVTAIEPNRIQTRFHDDGAPAWLATIRRI